MIEPTRDLEDTFAAAACLDGELHGVTREQIRAGLAAVLAAVERDYDVTPKLPPVEHRVRGESWWNHSAEGWEAECVCGESFAYWQRSEAEERLLDHIESTS